MVKVINGMRVKSSVFRTSDNRVKVINEMRVKSSVFGTCFAQMYPFYHDILLINLKYSSSAGCSSNLNVKYTLVEEKPISCLKCVC